MSSHFKLPALFSFLINFTTLLGILSYLFLIFITPANSSQLPTLYTAAGLFK